MVSLLVRHNVRDFAGWKKVFDSTGEMRKKAGALEMHVFRNCEKPNEVFVMGEWNSRKEAEAFLQDPMLKQKMMESGVTELPSIYLME